MPPGLGKVMVEGMILVFVSGSVSAKGSATFGDVQVKESVGLWDGVAQIDVEEDVCGQFDFECL